MLFTAEQRQEIYELYMKEVESICEECEWVTHFEPKDIINILLRIVENYG